MNPCIELIKWVFGYSPHSLNVIFTAFFANLPEISEKDIGFVNFEFFGN